MREYEEQTEKEVQRKNQRKKRKKSLQKGRILLCVVVLFLIGAALSEIRELFLEGQIRIGKELSLDRSRYPKELLELYENNEEAKDFVLGYPENKDKEFFVDLSKEIKKEEFPLLLQWDKRWGYEAYGSNMIALTGCGPTCLSMVYIGLTGDASMHPGKMAEFSEKNGFYTEGGTSWALMTEGAKMLGLSSKELILDENKMKQELSQKRPIICSMREGDFTKKGHFIVLRGIDPNGNFLLNDPNSRKNSEASWSYERISTQIKNLWVFYCEEA